jgi:transposase
VVDYEMFCKIRDLLDRQHLSQAQTARTLGLHPRTVWKWSRIEQYRPRPPTPRASRLDPYKGLIVRWLDTHPYSAQQILQRLREEGFAGGATIVKDYVHKIRPKKREAFLTLAFAPGECAQVDWGSYGTIGVGSTRRKLSFFVMVLCFSRRMYLEFTVSQTTEFFLGCHEHAFQAFGNVPARIMVDNLKSAVLQRLVGQAPVFNPRYMDFARHWGFEITPCNVGKGNEKGRVENGVGYIKKNFLAGLELADFSALQPAAQLWVDTVANVRVHRETHQRPIDRYEQERAAMRPLNALGFDLGRLSTLRASNQFRIAVDANRYSVPAQYANERVSVKAYPDRICVYHHDQLIARHNRSFDRHQDIEDPDHPRVLVAQRQRAREQQLMSRFLALSPRAQIYYQGLEAKRGNPRAHMRKILALAQIHGRDALVRALDDGIELQAFSCEYIANILEARRRIQPEPAPLQLTRRQDLLDLEIPDPDLSIYDRGNDESQTN